MKYVSNSVSETENIARSLAEKVTPPYVVCLFGGLGAGKTAFVRGFASAFGIERVTSPTFSIMHRYEGRERLNHYDLYRLSEPEELWDIGFDEEIESGISLIEWPDAFLEFMPDDRINVRISRGDGENTRIIEIEGAEA